MAGRRMFARTVITTGRFTRLSAGAQALYLGLGMEADDDGFAEGSMVLRMFGREEADLRALEKAGYVKVYGEDMITYIVDWDTNNQIRKDRYRESRYAYLLKEAPEETPQKAVSSKAVSQKRISDAREVQAETREMGPGEEDTRAAAAQVGDSLETAASHQGRAAREGGTLKTDAAPPQDSGRGADGAMETTVVPQEDDTMGPAFEAGSEDLPARSAGTGGEITAAGETDRGGTRDKKPEMPEGDIDWAHFHPQTDEDLQLFAEHLREKRRQKRQREKEELIQKYGFYIDVDRILYGQDPQQEAAG